MKLIVDFRGNQYSQTAIIKDKKGKDKEVRIKELFKATYTDFYKWTGFGWRAVDGNGYVMPTKEMEAGSPVRFHIDCNDEIRNRIAIFCNTFKIDFWSVETFDTGQVPQETKENPPEVNVDALEPKIVFDDTPEGRLRCIKNIEDAAVKRYANMRIMMVEKRIEDWIKAGKITQEESDREKTIFLTKLANFVNGWSLAGENWIKSQLIEKQQEKDDDDGIPFKEPVKKVKKANTKPEISVGVPIKTEIPKISPKIDENDEIMDMF